MDLKQREKLHAWLLEQRKRLLEEIPARDEARIEDVQAASDLSHLPTHPADHDAEGLEVELTVAETLRGELRAIDEALERIRNDDGYGQCQDCGQPIAMERLEAIPFTAYCIECERREEAERGGRLPR